MSKIEISFSRSLEIPQSCLVDSIHFKEHHMVFPNTRILQSLQNFLSRQLSKTSKFDGRFLLLAIIFIYFIPILFSTTFFTNYPSSSSWNSDFIYPLVPKMLPPFADMRVVTAGAECIRLGYDVLIENPCDPWKRPMNYPWIWSMPAVWGINQSHTVVLGIFCGILFFILTFVTIKRLNYIESLFYALILCSPSAMLAVERGNNDIIIFILLALSLLIIKSRNSIFRSFSYILILFTAILKLYPIFALTSCLKENRRDFSFIFICISIVFGIYLIGDLESLDLISKATPRSTVLSYGSKVIFDIVFPRLEKFSYVFLGSNITELIHMIKLPMLSLSILLVMFAAYVLAKNGENIYQKEKPLDINRIDAFRIGSSIYVGTFLIGNNWDYRLIFLLFTIPQILAWLKSGNRFSLIAGLALVGIILTTWLSRFGYFYLDELINWFLFLFYTYTLILTFPKWLKNYMYFQPRDFETISQ
jgi:hypothetical protein